MSHTQRQQISDCLRNEAARLDACQKAMREWTDDPDGLCELYIRFLDFCMDHDYPSNDYLKDHFDGVLQRHGIFVNDRLCDDPTSDNPEPLDGSQLHQVVCNGTTSGCIRFSGYNVATVYARHDSNIELRITDSAIVFVRVYDRARVMVTNAGLGSVTVLQYGGKVITHGEVSCSDMRAVGH